MGLHRGRYRLAPLQAGLADVCIRHCRPRRLAHRATHAERMSAAGNGSAIMSVALDHVTRVVDGVPTIRDVSLCDHRIVRGLAAWRSHHLSLGGRGVAGRGDAEGLSSSADHARGAGVFFTRTGIQFAGKRFNTRKAGSNSGLFSVLREAPTIWLYFTPMKSRLPSSTPL